MGGYLFFFFYKETPNLKTIAGIVISFIGASLLFFSGWNPEVSSHQTLGYLLSTCGAIFMATYLLLSKAAKSTLPLFEYIFTTYGFSAITLSLFLALSTYNAIDFSLSLNALYILGLLALGPQLIGHGIIIFVTRSISVTFVSLAVVCEPIGAAILAFLFFYETITFSQTISFIFLFFGVFLASNPKKKTKSFVKKPFPEPVCKTESKQAENN